MGNTASLSEGSDVYYRFSINNFVCNKCDNANYFTFSIEHESYDGSLTEVLNQESLNIVKQLLILLKRNMIITIYRDHIVGHGESNPLIETFCLDDHFLFKRFLRDLKEHYKNR